MKKIKQLVKNITLLYIEDDPFVRISMFEMLELIFQSSNITMATNGKEGLDQYKKYHTQTNIYYDIILTDINMPKLNGDEMSKIILSLNPKQNIIAMTAYNKMASLDNLQSMGVTIIKKPIVFEELIEAITTKVNKIDTDKNILNLNL